MLARSSLLVLVVLAACSGPSAVREGDLTSVPTPAALALETEGELVLEPPEGYTAVPLARGLSLPSGIAFDTAGCIYVLEAGGFMGLHAGHSPPRILVLSPEGKIFRAIELPHAVFPASGIVFADGGFFVTHRDDKHEGAISRVELDGRTATIVSGLPSQGDHGTNQLCLGPDGKLYFSQGTATNSGVVGVDDFVAFGWPRVHPSVHDVPAKNLVLTGKNFETVDPRNLGAEAVTGAFMPFGTTCSRGDGVKGSVKCNGAVLRCDKDGKNLEVYCWGLRNPFGLGFAPLGRLYATCQGMDLRGSRPIAEDVDALLSLRKDSWYGWPDYTTDLKPLLDDREHAPPASLGKIAEPLVDLRASDVATPDVSDVAATFPIHSSACGFAWAPPSFGRLAGRLLVAEFGSLAPVTGPFVPRFEGCKVVSIDDEGRVEDFLANAEGGPASLSRALGRSLERPVDVKFGPDGALYVVDYGVVSAHLEPSGLALVVREGTGSIWKVTPRGAAPRRAAEKAGARR